MRGRLLACLLVLAGGLATAHAQEQADVPGRFEFYVLALSWSPSYCEDQGERGDDEQCTPGRPYSFVVHGLWPQNERGWPEFCSGRERAVPRELAERMLPLMPSRNLIRHEWQKHGMCSGLSAAAYFDLIEDARSRIKVPAAYERIARPLRTSPNTVEAAFIAANPGLADEGVAVVCRGNRLREVRICLTKDLAFRSCEEIDRRACRRSEVVMPPIRGRS